MKTTVGSNRKNKEKEEEVEVEEEKQTRVKGTVVVAQKPGRGIKSAWPEREGFVRIDVTSGSNKKIEGHSATDFSPLFLGPVQDAAGNKALRFENYWQFTKVSLASKGSL